MKHSESSVHYNDLGVAVEPIGLQTTPSVWFGGGRVGARVGDYGAIEEIVYYGVQPMDNSLFYKTSEHSPYPKLYCPYLLVENRAYQLEWEQTLVFPAGYVSHLSLPDEGIDIEHALILLNDTLMYRVEVTRNERKLLWRLRLSLHEHLRAIPARRTWGDWRTDLVNGAMVAEITDFSAPQDEGTSSAEATKTWLAIVGSTPLETRLFRSHRRYFDSANINGNVATISILFSHTEEDCIARAAELSQHGPEIGAAQVANWEQRLRDVPVVEMNRPVVESFFRQAGLINGMLMLTDLPGAMRAAVGHYWVWGWDTMVYCDSYLVSGQVEFVRQALELYRRTADPELGVGHQFTEKMTVRAPQALPAQGLYLNMLYQYVAYTGDQAVLREYYPFARLIFERTLAQARSANLFKGIALWPDHPQFAGQKGGDADLSIFNNSIFYQAARAMEHMAGMLGDLETAVAARDAWLAQEKSFRNLFWDEERKYWVDSLDSKTLEKRRCYPAHAVLWVNPFAKELVSGREQACADFLSAQHACKGGIRPYPLWDTAFNGDGNQLGQHYPTGPDHFFLKSMGATGRQDMLRRWLGWVQAFWIQYTVPEGLTLEAENDGPHRPDCPGGKQPFTVKPWHMAIINTILGIDLDHGGITVCPGLDESVTLARLPFQGRQISVSTTGSGIYAKNITVNGKPLVGTCKIPLDRCADQMQISITRTTEPPSSPLILSADGASLSKVTTTEGTLQVSLNGCGSVRVWLYAPAKPQVTWNGVAIDATYDECTGRASVLLLPEGVSLEGELVITQCGVR